MLNQPPSAFSGNGALWAITTYFNPAGYQRRLRNYRIFRRHLSVPLLTVELAFDGDFELRQGDADRLLQLRGRDVMWHKERLLNIALNHLPAACDKLIWIDCDLVYTRQGWTADLDRLLDEFPIVQGFRRVLHLSRHASVERCSWGDEQLWGTSIASRNLAGHSTSDDFAGVDTSRASPRGVGLVWAARRDVISRHGFYDACIAGGGDQAFVGAAYGRFEAAIRGQCMTGPGAIHYLAWARPLYETIRGRVGCVDADILHLWHGDRADRRRSERHERLAEFGFDPFEDIAVDATSCWMWSSEKPGMHAWLRWYFHSRKEDG